MPSFNVVAVVAVIAVTVVGIAAAGACVAVVVNVVGILTKNKIYYPVKVHFRQSLLISVFAL